MMKTDSMMINNSTNTKIIFLDIDGVLNSLQFYENKTERELIAHPFDRENVIQLKKIVDATGASIVLTSSWRGGWDKDPEKCTLEGRLLNELFSEFHMKILDKTPALDKGGRTAEIRAFMKGFDQTISSYVIIDDNDFGWKKAGMDPHLVMTDFLDGGLKCSHVERAIAILNRERNINPVLRIIEFIRNFF